MTTPPPTAEPFAVPSDLPDEATINRWAAAFWSAMPGEPTDLTANQVVPPGTPGLPTSTPAGPPPTSAPQSYATTAGGVGLPLVPGTEALGLAPAFPTDAPMPSVEPSFYFLDGHGAGATPASPATPGFGAVRVPAVEGIPAVLDSPSGLPGSAEFPSGFYFLDEALPGGHIPDLPLDPHPAFDVHGVRRDFPILSEVVKGKPLIWLDNAATTQKPQSVIDRLAYFYAHENSNIHRAAHTLAARATDAYESARDTVADFLGAASSEEIVFVRGSTEAINLVAKAWGGRHVKSGDEIVISHLEHHANIVPWQMLAQRTGAVIKVIPVDDSGQILLDAYTDLLSDRTKMVAVTQVSNALGTITPVERIVELAHRAGARVLIDGAQSVPHTPVDMQAMGADFFVFSGHKVFGPTGIGVVYGRADVLEETPPWQGGGNMITDVTPERALYDDPPGRFEAGTGNIADAVGLATALDYVSRIGMPNIAAYEHALLEYATPRLAEVPGLRLIGTAAEKASVLSFVLAGHEPHEVGQALNSEGIAVRAGHHCAQPILRRFGLEATVRPSLAFYNTCEEIDTLVAALHRLAARARRG
jgi:cysteine desulfurase/selenocysteine lyase